MAGYIGSKAVITSGISASIDELNIIDGVTATTAELNILDGVTSTAAELNYNDTGAAVGVVVASKTVTADANKDVASLRNVTATGVATVGSVVVADGGNIGAASDTDSLAIASNGVVTFSQAPVFPDGSLNLADLDIDGGTDIGAALVDADLMIVDDGAGGTNRKATMTRLATYMNTKVGTAAAILPSNWASADETFTSSATYSKHSSLADDEYIWFYVVSGGGGSGAHDVNAQAGLGGGAMLIYGKAGDFHQAVMVIGAGGAGSTNQTRTSGGTSSLTLRANIGARAFSGLTNGPHSFNASAVGTYVAGAIADPYKFTVPLPITVSGVAYAGSGFGAGSQNVVGNFLFGGAAAGARGSGTTAAAGNSLFGGAAGASEAADGAVPGGAGATDHQDSSGSQGGAGGAGNIRVYHVS